MPPKTKPKYQIIIMVSTYHVDTALTKLQMIGDVISLTKLDKDNE